MYPVTHSLIFSTNNYPGYHLKTPFYCHKYKTITHSLILSNLSFNLNHTIMKKTVANIKLNGSRFYNTREGFKSFKTGQIYSIETMRVMWLACAPDKRQIVWKY